MDTNFGKRLKEIRFKRQLSQTKLAEIANLHYTQIGRYEKGETRPSLKVLKRLAEALEVSVDSLLEGDSEGVADSQLYDKDLLHQFKQVQELDKQDKFVIKALIDAFLAKRQIQKIVK